MCGCGGRRGTLAAGVAPVGVDAGCIGRAEWMLMDVQVICSLGFGRVWAAKGGMTTSAVRWVSWRRRCVKSAMGHCGKRPAMLGRGTGCWDASE